MKILKISIILFMISVSVHSFVNNSNVLFLIQLKLAFLLFLLNRKFLSF